MPHLASQVTYGSYVYSVIAIASPDQHKTCSWSGSLEIFKPLAAIFAKGSLENPLHKNSSVTVYIIQLLTVSYLYSSRSQESNFNSSSEQGD